MPREIIPVYITRDHKRPSRWLIDGPDDAAVNALVPLAPHGQNGVQWASARLSEILNSGRIPHDDDPGVNVVRVKDGPVLVFAMRNHPESLMLEIGERSARRGYWLTNA